MRILLLAIAAALTVAPAQAQRNKQPQVTAEALRAMQTKEFAAPTLTVFPAVISTLTDLGYMIDSADKDTGLIKATEAAKTKVSGLGLNQKKTALVITAFVEPRGSAAASIRLNIVENFSYNYMGKPYRNTDTVITTSATYTDVFSRIETAVSARMGAT